MRNLLLVISILTSFIANGQEEYVIQLNDTIFEVALDKEYKISINGEAINFTINAKDTLLFNDDFYSFQYFKEYKVSKIVIEEGIEQIILMTAEGSGILIQKYLNINPTMLNEIMISEVTKESLNYGFKMERKDYKRELKSGQKLNVDRVILTYKDETNIYEVASIGNKDEGILIMTMIMDEKISQQGRKIIDLMWGSLKYK
ncbi:MAG: hypothetical protein KOO66_12590 [Bacteroidales bacterium]|nr:hypothetical protein [Bacteroidales bacterium]